MRKMVLCIMVLLILSSFPIGIPRHSTTEHSLRASAVASEVIDRVYGIDYSRTVFQKVSLQTFRNYVIKLTENGSRWIQSPTLMSQANAAAREWIAVELVNVSNGRISVEILGEHHSVLGRLPGYLPVHAPAILVGGHYDSIPAGPGANDDGTGVAAVLELARVLSQYNWPLDIYFGAWNAEEIGLVGSGEVAHIMSQRGVELLVHYNVDMLLVPHPEKLSVLMAYPIGSYQDGKYWADLPSAMSSNYGANRIEPIISSAFSGWQSSDHWPFIQHGYQKSLFAHESGAAYDYAYHTGADVWNNILYNYNVAIEGVKAIGAAIAYSMRRAYQQPISDFYTFNLNAGNQKNFSLTISGETVINVTSRWFGGHATFTLYGPQGNILNQVIRDVTSPWEMSTVIAQEVSSEGIYRLIIHNQGTTTTGFDLALEYDTDMDGNDIPDSQEFWFDANLFLVDTDSDSLSDGQEMILGTSWLSADSDSDQMPDNWEINYGLNPLDPSDAMGDADYDSLSNLDEFLNGCNPNLSDSDSDQIPDSYEVEHGLDPTRDDSLEDADHDMVTNLDEYLQGTDPQYAELRLERLFIPIAGFIGLSSVILAGFLVWRRNHRP